MKTIFGKKLLIKYRMKPLTSEVILLQNPRTRRIH